MDDVVEEVAEGGAPEAAVDVEEPAAKKAKPPPAKPGEKKLKGALAKVTALKKSIATKENQLAAAAARALIKALPSAERDKVEGWNKKLEQYNDELETAEKEVEEARSAMVVLGEAAKKKEEAKKDKEEIGRAISEAGALHVVDLWTSLKFQTRFNNSSDTVHAIWEHIHVDFMKAVERGDLPFTDGRGVKALRKKYMPG